MKGSEALKKLQEVELAILLKRSISLVMGYRMTP